MIVLIRDQFFLAREPRNLDLWMPAALEALNKNQVAGREFGDQLLQWGLRRVPQFMHQGPSLPRGDDDFMRAGFAMPIAIFAGNVDIKCMMRMLNGRYAQSARRHFSHQRLDKRCLAAVLPADNAKNLLRTHAGLRTPFNQACAAAMSAGC